MTEETPTDESRGGDSYPQIDAKKTDKQLPNYFSNSFTRYTDFAPLARGGSAQLRTCLDNNLGRTVVMKTLHPQLADREYLRARFLREARVTAQLAHPNTVPVYELGQDIEGRLYFTMKKVVGQTLREILELQLAGDEGALETFDLERMLGVLIQVCNALASAHDHGVVHRDVKPENILVGNYGEVILLDWGVAKVWAAEDDDAANVREHEELTDVGQRPGTPLYMSPEQIKGGGVVDSRSDVYSIGVVLYEVLTLKEPLRGSRVNETFDMVLNKMPTPPRERTPNRSIPVALDRIAMRALQKDAADRFQSMQEFIDAVRDFRGKAMQSSTNME